MKIRLSLLFILTALTALGEDAFQLGIDAYHDSEYASAAEAFQKAANGEETAAARHNLALAHYQEGKVSEAIWNLERAVLLDPKNVEYQFKLGALRQQLGLPIARPEWHEVAGRALSQQDWILLLCLCFWVTLAAILLPKISGCRVNLYLRAARTLGLIGLIASAVALYHTRHLTSQGIVLSDTPATLHAAPASAAPQSGLARPGERARLIDSHGDYVELETEGGAQGWLRATQYRLVMQATASPES